MWLTVTQGHPGIYTNVIQTISSYKVCAEGIQPTGTDMQLHSFWAHQLGLSTLESSCISEEHIMCRSCRHARVEVVTKVYIRATGKKQWGSLWSKREVWQVSTMPINTPHSVLYSVGKGLCCTINSLSAWVWSPVGQRSLHYDNGGITFSWPLLA